MTEPGNAEVPDVRPRRGRRRIAQGVAIAALIVAGIVAGARLWQPVKIVEQRMAAPISKVVQRASPLDRLTDQAAAACPAIVSLRLPGADGAAPQGVLISGDGHVVTTALVPPNRAFGAWLDGRRLTGRLEARDPLTGISLVKLEGEDLPALALADPDIALPGSSGFTLSSPNGSGCIVEQAIVASDFATDGATHDYYLRVHGTGEPSPDGTPFLSADGRIVGLAQSGMGQGGGRDRYLPADLVTLVISRLMRTGAAPSGSFGILAQDLSPVLAARLGVDRGRGAVVVLVARGSSAEAAGFQIGDVILSAARMPISSASELARILGGSDPIEIIVSRGRERTQLTFTLTPATRP